MARTTKRDVILEGIDKEIASVKADIAATEAEMAVHRGNLSSLYAVEHALEKLRKQTAESLAPQPRQPVTKPASSTSRASKDSPSRGKGQCAHEYPNNRFCGQPNTDPIHAEDNDDVFAHAFIVSGARKKSSIKKRARLPQVDTFADELCQHVFDGGLVCNEPPDTNIHHLRGVTNFHPFVSLARGAQPPSSANGVESNGTASSEVETVAAGVVAHGASERG
jgi:hypothetical protein